MTHKIYQLKVESSEAGDRAWEAKSTENLQKIKQVSNFRILFASALYDRSSLVNNLFHKSSGVVKETFLPFIFSLPTPYSLLPFHDDYSHLLT